MSVTVIRYWGSHLKSSRHARSYANLFRNVASLGWRNCLVCSRPPNDLSWLDPFREVGTQIEYLPRPRGSFDQACIRRAVKLCRRLKCDILHCDNIHTSPLIGAALAGVPVRLWSKRGMQPAFVKGRKPTVRDWLAPSVRVSCSLATRVLPVSKAVGDELVQLGIPASKIIVFNNAVDIQEFQGLDREGSRVGFGYNCSELVISTIGHAVPVKGWDLLIRAFAEVAREVPQARLLLVGSFSDGHEHSCYMRINQLIDEFKLGSKVHFAGHLNNISPVLAASDVFVLPSRSEGNSNALLQALVVGLPCIATRVGNAPEIIKNGSNGFLVERNDSRQIANVLLLLARDPQLRRRVSSAAKHAKVAPTCEEYAEGLSRLYVSLLHSRRRK